MRKKSRALEIIERLWYVPINHQEAFLKKKYSNIFFKINYQINIKNMNRGHGSLSSFDIG